MRASEWIKVRGARQHNLQNIDVDLPRQMWTVLTGVSGSGKSSLAFDTLYAEGQRRYVQSLSAYARQFLGQLEKPDVDYIEGLSPAVAIEQAHSSPNPRSTIATVTEIYDYLRVLYAVAGIPHDPQTGEVLVRSTSAEMGDHLMALPDGTRLVVLAPVPSLEQRDLRVLFDKLRRQGFVRARLDGEMIDLENDLASDSVEVRQIEVVVDRLVIRGGARARLMESIETALHWNNDEIRFLIGESDPPEVLSFTTAFANPRTGYLLPKLTPQHFSFNTHLGACPVCEGIGTRMAADSGLLVPDPDKTLAEGAVKSWWSRQPQLKAIHQRGIEALARHFAVPMDTPFSEVPPAFSQALFHGTGEQTIATGWKTSENRRSVAKPYEGLLPQIQRLYRDAESDTVRGQLSRFMNPKPCPACEGRRLQPESLAVRLASTHPIGARAIHEFGALSIDEALAWLDGMFISSEQQSSVGELQREIANRIRFLQEVGLGYLTLDRESGTLSGGEMQRIRLATQIGASLAGVLYVLDEPSIGLHPVDTERLILTLKRLRDLGNTVVVVEHDESIIRAADHIVELGPGAGPQGGQIIAQGTVEEIAADSQSITGAYLSGRERVSSPHPPIQPLRQSDLLNHNESAGWLTVHGAREHNLQNLTVAFPLGCLTCVTGPSGSGKSSLVDAILMRVLLRHFHNAKEKPGLHDHLTGLGGIDKVVVIDQSPIGRSPRSNPATYTGLFTPIRELFAQLPAARVRGYDSGRFSFNVAGGRCEKCQGDGQLRIDMHFLADVYVVCDQCQGRRYNSETLEVTFKGKTIADVLDLSVSEAVVFFGNHSQLAPKLRALDETGLGYMRLGQPGNTVSGGEAQRIKLAAELGKRATGHTLFLLDEPTTGLHFADIQKLLNALLRLRDAGNSVIVVEHNLDLIRSADWLIDLGPGGGVHGGRLIAQGSPTDVAANPDSVTGRFLDLQEKRA